MASLPPADDNQGDNNANDEKNTLTTNAILEMLKQSNMGGDDEADKKHAFWDTQVS